MKLPTGTCKWRGTRRRQAPLSVQLVSLKGSTKAQWLQIMLEEFPISWRETNRTMLVFRFVRRDWGLNTWLLEEINPLGAALYVLLGASSICLLHGLARHVNVCMSLGMPWNLVGLLTGRGGKCKSEKTRSAQEWSFIRKTWTFRGASL